MQAVLLAGGKGSRLRPFTTNIPKPLIPVDGTPIVEILMRQLKYYGFKEIILAVNHLSELIMAFFGKGEKLGIKIRYVEEEKALGTAGPLALIDDLEENVLVANGDLLTTMNFADFFREHTSSGAAASIGAYKEKTQLEFGVLKHDENYVLQDYVEKPTFENLIAMGISVISKKAVAKIPHNEFFTIPDLLLKLKADNELVRCYTADYYWLDIGRTSDYEEACAKFAEDKKIFVPDWQA